MGNVLTVHMASEKNGSTNKASEFWDNGSELGKFIEHALMKDEILRKRACCMGLASDDTSRPRKDFANKGLSVPIANIGYTDMDFNKLPDGKGAVPSGKNEKFFRISAKPVELDKIFNQVGDEKLFVKEAMIIKKLSFPELQTAQCTMDPADMEKTDTTGPRQYKPYADLRNHGDTPACDNFYQRYAKNSLTDRQCIKTNSDGTKELDRSKPGCRKTFMDNGTTVFDLKSKGDTATRYPEDISCIASPFSALYNADPGNDNSVSFGNLFGHDAIQANPKLMDSYCIARSTNRFTGGNNEAYLVKSMRGENETCINIVDMDNINIGEAEINIEQNNTCPGSSNITKEDKEIIEQSEQASSPPVSGSAPNPSTVGKDVSKQEKKEQQQAVQDDTNAREEMKKAALNKTTKAAQNKTTKAAQNKSTKAAQKKPKDPGAETEDDIMTRSTLIDGILDIYIYGGGALFLLFLVIFMIVILK